MIGLLGYFRGDGKFFSNGSVFVRYCASWGIAYSLNPKRAMITMKSDFPQVVEITAYTEEIMCRLFQFHFNV